MTTHRPGCDCPPRDVEIDQLVTLAHSAIQEIIGSEITDHAALHLFEISKMIKRGLRREGYVGRPRTLEVE